MPDIPVESCAFSSILLDSSPLRILSYNLFLRPPFVHNNKSDYKDERLAEFLSRIDKYDVMFLQEVFALGNTRQSRLIRVAKEKGFPYSCVATAAHWLSLRKPVDGGVLVVSRYPIEECDASVYEQAVDVDSLCMKQVLHAKIMCQGGPLHCFTTHTQAQYFQVSAKQRLDSLNAAFSQIRQLSQFVLQKMQDNSAPALVAGDFNINGRGQDGKLHSEEYNTMFSLLQTPAARFHVRVRDVLFEQLGMHPVTCGDVDDDGFPVERVLTYLVDLGRPLSLDYIFLYEREPKSDDDPLSITTAIDVAAQVEPFTVSDRPFTHLSDHYGVSCKIRL